MNEQSEKWDSQWCRLLTHCHGAVEADQVFKSTLLVDLKRKVAENRDRAEAADAARRDAGWSRLLAHAYVPCDPSPDFKATLLQSLKQKQALSTANPEAPDVTEPVIQAILASSFQPVKPRQEFETRLLANLKERQRTNTGVRRRNRRRTLFMVAMTSMSAAAMAVFVLWSAPMTPDSSPPASLNVLDIAGISHQPQFVPVAAESISQDHAVMPAAFEYRIADAFADAPLPRSVVGLKNIEADAGAGWQAMDADTITALMPGMLFRVARGSDGSLGFSDNTMLTMSSDALVEATPAGLHLRRGSALLSVPDTASRRFRLFFPERDIAVEPGTQLAMFVPSEDEFAAGGAPAPQVMVVEDGDTRGGLALARGKYGVGPLFARYLYNLDNYVTPDLPGRPMCETECEDLEKMFKAQTLQSERPMAAFAGGSVSPFGGARFERSFTTVYTPVGFVQQGDRWQAETYRGGPTVRIRYLSDEYFGLANGRRDLARGLALGGNVILDGGDGVFYEIFQ
ncbi:MAG: hypothetical protein LIP77_09410 [Planctomycetes bacterium]|nr:hypothetical protein [Planctomycetota bacterium]